MDPEDGGGIPQTTSPLRYITLFNVFLCETNCFKFSQEAFHLDLPDGAHVFRASGSVTLASGALQIGLLLLLLLLFCGCMFVTTTDEQPLTSRFWIRPYPSPCSSFDV